MHATDSTVVRDARLKYFKQNGFAQDGGYSDKWVKLKIGPAAVPFPNPPARQRAVWLHDLHHIATGYETSWTGEAEMAAWELGSGCGNYYAAWVLDSMTLGVGLFVAPRRVWNAFQKGRQSTSLYCSNVDERIFNETVGQLRQRLQGAKERP